MDDPKWETMKSFYKTYNNFVDVNLWTMAPVKYLRLGFLPVDVWQDSEYVTAYTVKSPHCTRLTEYRVFH